MDRGKIQNSRKISELEKFNICGIVNGETREIIIRQVREAVKKGAELIEWQAQGFSEHKDANIIECMKLVLKDIRSEAKRLPIIFTYRGDNLSLAADIYKKIIKLNKKAKFIEFVDVDVALYQAHGEKLAEKCLDANVKIILSKYETEKSLTFEQAVEELKALILLKTGCIPKLAVVAKTEVDALNLMKATMAVKEEYKGPIISVAMGAAGAATAALGRFAGSALTYGSVAKGKKRPMESHGDVDSLKATVEIFSHIASNVKA